MASLNKITVIGYVGNEPEMRFTPSGKPVTNFNVATSYSYTKEGEKVEETTWFSVSCWGKLAETVNQFLSKGRQVYVEGRLQTQEWETPSGQTKFKLEIVADKVMFLGKSDSEVGDGS